MKKKDLFTFYISNHNYKLLPKYGWKIHISCFYDNFNEILDITSTYCFKHNICFKHINSIKNLSILLSKPLNNKSGGKFITIYPVNEFECNKILNDLYVIFKPYKFNCATILGDNNFKDSNLINYRYGYFFENINIPLDIPKYDPFQKEDDSNDSTDSLVFNNKYLIENLIKLSYMGRVYSAIDLNSKNKVIIKEAHQYTGYSEVFTSTYLRENEKNISLLDLNFIPKFIESFSYEDHLFYVYEKINGKTLNSYNFFEENCFYKDLNITPKNNIYSILSNLLTTLHHLHNNNIILNDISPTNIMIDNNKIYFIDTEHSYFSSSNCYLDSIKEDYIDQNYSILDNFSKDKMKLGYFIISLLTGTNYYLNIDKSGQTTLDFFYTISKYISLDINKVDSIISLIKNPKESNLNNLAQILIKPNNYSYYDIDKKQLKKLLTNKINKYKKLYFKFNKTIDNNIFNCLYKNYSDFYNITEDKFNKFYNNSKITKNDNKYIKYKDALSPYLKNGSCGFIEFSLCKYTLTNNKIYLKYINEFITGILKYPSKNISVLEGNFGILHTLYKLNEILNYDYVNIIIYRLSLSLELLDIYEKNNNDLFYNVENNDKLKHDLFLFYNLLNNIKEKGWLDD